MSRAIGMDSGIPFISRIFLEFHNVTNVDLKSLALIFSFSFITSGFRK